MFKSMRLLSFIVAAVSLLFAAPAVAGNSSDLAAPLGKIKWGDRKEVVVKKVKKQLLARLAKREELKHDRTLAQRERKRVLDDIDRFRKSHEKLGDDNSYKVSVISDEFTPGNGESLMRVKDRVANRYFFFVDGGLYKMVVAYNQEYLEDIDFETFVVQTAKKYGRPADTAYETVEGEESLVGATWEGRETLLEVSNKKEFFDTFTMSFADRATAERLAKVRAALEDGEDDDGLSSRVKSLTRVTNDDSNDDVVDSIVGDSEINLNEGRPVDEQVRHGEKAQNGEAVAAKDESKSKKKKKRKKKRKKKKKKRDFSDIEASSGGGDDDLIIY